MEIEKRTRDRRHRISIKWWWKNNRIIIIIIIGICVLIGLMVSSEVKHFNDGKEAQAILNKDHKTIVRDQGGLTDEDIEKLQRAMPEINWEETSTRKKYKDQQEGK